MCIPRQHSTISKRRSAHFVSGSMEIEQLLKDNTVEFIGPTKNHKMISLTHNKFQHLHSRVPNIYLCFFFVHILMCSKYCIMFDLTFEILNVTLTSLKKSA